MNGTGGLHDSFRKCLTLPTRLASQHASMAKASARSDVLQLQPGEFNKTPTRGIFAASCPSAASGTSVRLNDREPDPPHGYPGGDGWPGV